MPKVKQIFRVETPDYLWVADKPPRLGGVPKKLPVAEVEAKFNFTYTESILASGRLLEFHGEPDTHPDLTRAVNQYARRAKDIIDKLVLCYIGDERIGWGVFAREDLPANTMLAIYAGEIVKDHEQIFDPYGLENGDDHYSVSAGQYGGIARFFQHAPFNPEHEIEALAAAGAAPAVLNRQLIDAHLQTLRESAKHDPALKETFIEFDSLRFLSSSAKENMAWDNIKTQNVRVNGVNMRIFSTRQAIPAGDLITFSYGIGYWVTCNVMPELFERSGRVLDHSCYSRNYMTVPANIIANTETSAEKERIFLYFVQIFLAYDLLRQFPVMLFPGTQLFSNFYLRHQLVRSNALDESFNPLDDTQFVLRLREALQDLKPKIQAFYRDPRENVREVFSEHAYLVDVVCQMDSVEKWIYVTKIARNFLGQDMVKAFQATREILFKGVNLDANCDKVQGFIRKLPSLRALAHMPTPREVEVIVAESPEKNMLYFFTQPAARERLTPDGQEQLAELLRQFRL
jgi:hypothetical protein